MLSPNTALKQVWVTTYDGSVANDAIHLSDWYFARMHEIPPEYQPVATFSTYGDQGVCVGYYRPERPDEAALRLAKREAADAFVRANQLTRDKHQLAMLMARQGTPLFQTGDCVSTLDGETTDFGRVLPAGTEGRVMSVDQAGTHPAVRVLFNEGSHYWVFPHTIRLVQRLRAPAQTPE